MENCYLNCKSSLKVNGLEMASEERGLVFNIVTIDTYDGKAGNFSISFNTPYIPTVVLEQARKFLAAITKNSIIIILSQGCALLLDEVKDILKHDVKTIERFQDFQRVNAIIECKGECPLEDVAYTKNAQRFRKSFEIPLKGL